MRRGGNQHTTGIAFVLGWAALALVLALAGPGVARAQTQTTEQVPSELWETYPLDPSKGQARLRRETEPDRQEPPPPTAVDTTTVRADVDTTVREERQAAEAPPQNDDSSSTVITLGLVGLSLVALLLVVVALRPVAAGVRAVPSPLAGLRTTGPLPSRSGVIARRPVRRIARRRVVRRRIPRPSGLIRGVFARGRRVGVRTASYAGWTLLAPVRAGAALGAGLRSIAAAIAAMRGPILVRGRRIVARTASYAGWTLLAPVRVGAALGVGLRSIAIAIAAMRGPILVYSIAIVMSIAVGLGVMFLVGG